MNFLTALKLSGKNIMTKKWRTGLTAFASSIGIIGIALVLSLSNGFNKQIDSYEKGTLSNFPITISQTATDISKMTPSNKEKKIEFPKDNDIYPYDSSKTSASHTNVLTEKYIDYINKIDTSWIDGISYSRSINMNILKKQDNKATALNLGTINFTSYPVKKDDKSSSYLKEYYDVLEGNLPSDKTQIVLAVDKYNQVNKTVLEELGIDSDKKSINFKDIIGKEFKLVLNNDYYAKADNNFRINGNPSDLSALYNSSKAITLKISGVIRIKNGVNISALPAGIIYSDELSQFFINDAMKSQIVKAQQSINYNVLTGGILSNKTQTSTGMSPVGPTSMGGNATGMNIKSSQTKEDVLKSLGASYIPTTISLYPINFDSKEKITQYLDKWNNGLDEKDQIKYTDMASMVTTLSKNLMDSITLVLVAFAAISLFVSLIMIAIITYISVLERTKEIGVLRALGARKKDITRVFNAETFIIGLCSGTLGILIAYLLTFPVNSILYKITNLSNVAMLNPVHSLVLVLLSLILTVLGGALPAKMAAKKDPVTALRSE
ncbi:hypothetical protein rsdtw13_05020 [Clostridium sp. TW13]|uniref:Uncharacterized protein n=1 Tax=Inconstantimicrobium mannanitabidum TaxID=1604901 RepID=A0ACB5R8Q1_9CLOT|nr:hypothetical protein rsdtw13_05020 [Clostridium sp. TW13]